MKTLNGYEIPESWDEVKLSKYIDLFNGVDEEANAGDKTIRIVANLLGASKDTIMDMNAGVVGEIIGSIGFIQDKITEDTAATIRLANKLYKVLKLSDMPYRQYINIEAESKDKGRLDYFVANMLVDEDGAYDQENIDIVAGLLRDKPITEVMPLLNYFSGQKKS